MTQTRLSRLGFNFTYLTILYSLNAWESVGICVLIKESISLFF